MELQLDHSIEFLVRNINDTTVYLYFLSLSDFSLHNIIQISVIIQTYLILP